MKDVDRAAGAVKQNDRQTVAAGVAHPQRRIACGYHPIDWRHGHCPIQ
jgi:hypothetical protein